MEKKKRAPRGTWTDERVIEVIKAKATELGRMPKRRDFNNNAITRGVVRLGGYLALAEKLGIERKPVYETWGRERVLKELKVLVAKLKRMPTLKEAEELVSDKFRWQLSFYGTRELAAEVGATLKGAHTHFGNDWEDWAAEKLRKRGHKVTRPGRAAPYDILVDGVRVDVKASRRLTHGQTGDRMHTFTLGDKCKTEEGGGADLYMCIALKEDEKTVDKILYVPASAAKVSHITFLARGSKKWGQYVEAAEFLPRRRVRIKKSRSMK